MEVPTTYTAEEMRDLVLAGIDTILGTDDCMGAFFNHCLEAIRQAVRKDFDNDARLGKVYPRTPETIDKFANWYAVGGAVDPSGRPFQT